MASYDAVDLLLSFNEKAGRPTSNDGMTDARKYARLSKSQNRLITMMAPVVPNSLYPKVAYGSLPTLTTTDNQVYTFGNDPLGYALFPMGKGGIYTSPNDIPGNPLRPGVDYMIEGTQIRALNNTTLPSVLYWYGIAQPADIAAAAQPAIFPETARELIVIDAVRQVSQEGVRDAALFAMMQGEWSIAWPLHCLNWRTQYRGGGALDCWTGLQLALAAQY